MKRLLILAPNQCVGQHYVRSTFIIHKSLGRGRVIMSFQHRPEHQIQADIVVDEQQLRHHRFDDMLVLDGVSASLELLAEELLLRRKENPDHAQVLRWNRPTQDP